MNTSRLPGIGLRLWTAVAFAVFGWACARTVTLAPKGTATATHYTIRHDAVADGKGASAAVFLSQRASWQAEVEWVAGRGRIDVVTGSMPPNLAAGDYMLFDSLGFVAVHPASRTYDLPPRDASVEIAASERAAFISTVMVDIKVSIDSASRMEDVAEHRVRLYRVTASYASRIRYNGPNEVFGEALNRETRTSSVTEFWLAPGMQPVPGPLTSTRESLARLSTPGMKALRDSLVAIMRLMPSGRILKTVTTMHSFRGADTLGYVVRTTTTSDGTTRRVSPSRFVLPLAYTSRLASDSVTRVGPDPAARWRLSPAAATVNTP